MFPKEKYHYYVTNNKTTVAVSSYAGKTVRGIAKVDPKDTYDPNFGMELAAARCAVKVAKKRKARAAKQVRKAAEAYNKAYKYFEKMKTYEADAIHDFDEATFNLVEVMTKA